MTIGLKHSENGFPITLLIEENGDLSQAWPGLLKMISHTGVILFDGNLGAGKTTLIKSFARNVLDIHEMTSPTFSVINLHQGQFEGKKMAVAHMDLYRLKDSSEFFQLGGQEYLDDSGTLCLIEWPEVALPFLGDFGLVRIERMDDGTRKLTLSLETVNEVGNE